MAPNKAILSEKGIPVKLAATAISGTSKAFPPPARRPAMGARHPGSGKRPKWPPAGRHPNGPYGQPEGRRIPWRQSPGRRGPTLKCKRCERSVTKETQSTGIRYLCGSCGASAFLLPEGQWIVRSRGRIMRDGNYARREPSQATIFLTEGPGDKRFPFDYIKTRFGISRG